MTTNSAETELLINNINRILVNMQTTVYYTIDIVGRRTDAVDSSAFCLKGVATNMYGTISDVGKLYEVVVARSNSSIQVDARTTSNGLGIFVTGASSQTIKWTAYVRTVEVSG